MAAAKPASTDFGAAMAGLVLGGSVIFLVILTIVWLTNSHFADLKASGAHGAPPAATVPAGGAPAAPAAAPTGH
ncbi:MAG: hypothetical protein M3R07_02310 [Gemmatimonadota bacterium]|nr:hypothetical protein [Gemmatimonadota bacterium]